ncbi:MAG: hypothetical protein ACKODU_06820, partial [Limnohabitans sp.]
VMYFVVLLRGYRRADLTVVYPLARGSAHSRQVQRGTSCQPSQRPSGAQNTIMTSALKAENRTSPDAFLAAIFQQA